MPSNQPEIQLAVTTLERRGFGGDIIRAEAESDCGWYDREEEAACQDGRRAGYAYTHGAIHAPYPSGSILRERWWDGWWEGQDLRRQEAARNGHKSVKHKLDFDAIPGDISGTT